MGLPWGCRDVADDIRGLKIIRCNVTIVCITSCPAHNFWWVLIVGVDIWQEVAVVYTINNYVGDMAVRFYGHDHGDDDA